MNKPNKPNKPKSSPKKPNAPKRHQGKDPMFGSVGGYKGVNKNMVRKLVNDQIKPELRSMRSDRRYVNRQANDAIGDVNSLYERSVGDLRHVFGEAGDYIGHMGQQINNGYADTAAKVAANDQSVAGQIQANTDVQQRAIQAELERLGIQQTGVLSGLQADSQFAENVSNQIGANNQANLAASQQAAGTVSALLGGMIQGSQASNLGRALNTRNASVSDINSSRRDDLSTVLESMQEMRKQRPGMIREMLMQLQAQGFDQWQAIQALNLDKRSLAHAMAMDNAGMTEDAAYYGTAAGAWGAQANAPAGYSTGASHSSGSSPSGAGGWPTGTPANPTIAGGSKGSSKGPKKPTKFQQQAAGSDLLALIAGQGRRR